MWYPKDRIDLKMIHNESNVLTDDELVAATGSSKSQSMHIYIYEMNILVDFVLNKNDKVKEKSNNTRKTSCTCCPRS